MLITGTFTKSLAIWLQKAICHTRILSWGNGRHVFETRREEGINFDTFWKEPINAVWSTAYARLELGSSESQNKYFRFSLTDASQSNSVRTHWGMLTFDTNCWYFDILFIRLTTNFSNALNLVTASSFIVKKWNDDIQKQIKPVLRRYKNDFVASPTKLIAISTIVHWVQYQPYWHWITRAINTGIANKFTTKVQYM